jgi:predicted DNA-binding transcriptional regulator YafY
MTSAVRIDVRERKMRASRLLSIMLLLQARGRINATVLAEELEVSVRTIYRDIDELSAAGVPVYADRGAEGGFQLLDGYRTQLTGLTSDEAGTLFLFGLPKAAADLGLGDAMTEARRKVDAALPEAKRRGANVVSSRFHLDTAGWFKPIEQPDLLPQLAGAVWSGHRISVTYESWTNTSSVHLSPLGLVLKAGAWYLVASGARGTPATYRVAAMRNLSVSDETFDRPEDFDLRTYWIAASKAFERSLQKGTAQLRVSGRGFGLVGKLGAEVAKAAEMSRSALDRDGWSIIEIPVERIENAVCDILSLGADAVLLGPDPLIVAVADVIGKLTAQYCRPA